MGRNINRRSFIILLICIAVLVTVSGTGDAAKKKVSQQYVLTAAELQLELMSYADRYAATVVQAAEDVERLEFSPEMRRAVVGDVVFSAAAAFTIAADSDPQLALLDMVVMTTLGRMVYRGILAGPHLGDATVPMIAAFEKLERDIWNVASPILDSATARGAAGKDRTFRENNPELSTFSHLRFADFPSKRPDSTLQKKKSGGIFSFGQEHHRAGGADPHLGRDGPSSCRPGCRCSPADLPTSGSPDSPSTPQSRSSEGTSTPLPRFRIVSPRWPSSCPRPSTPNARRPSNRWRGRRILSGTKPSNRFLTKSPRSAGKFSSSLSKRNSGWVA